VLKEKLDSDPVVQNMYQAIKINADQVLEKDFLTRQKIGKRLLSVSREMLWRVNMLGMVYRIERDPRMVGRINDELIAVCSFQDWNPSHFLDVAEMSLAVALAVDWVGNELPESTVSLAKTALIEKGIKPSWDRPRGRGPFYGDNNWNQVCNGGMIAAAIAIADDEPELAAKTLHRALDGLPNALVHYGPDGAHPEGASYWEYATSYTAISASMLESALGSDFGIWRYPGFAESATYRLMMETPSGRIYNYGDCSDRRGSNGDLTLAWFAAKTGNHAFLEKKRFLRTPKKMGTLTRYAGVGLVWLSQYQQRTQTPMPTAWAGRGINPVVVFRAAQDHPRSFYFGAKGGSAAISHGNMDAGSFVLDLNGVRWSLEVGKQDYNTIEQTGLNLWDGSQGGDRWKLLSKNNFGHSTITINHQLHLVDGKAELVHFNDGVHPHATFDMTPVLGDLVSNATRTFTMDSESSILVEDMIEISDKTDQITWQMITVADASIVAGGANLEMEGKRLKLETLSHPDIQFSIVSLNPPPFKLDRRIENLKRLELSVPVSAVKEGRTVIRIRLSSD
jgi:hypothetical protein